MALTCVHASNDINLRTSVRSMTLNSHLDDKQPPLPKQPPTHVHTMSWTFCKLGFCSGEWLGLVSIAAQLSVNVTASPSWANEERLAGLVQPLPQLRINSTDWNILLLNKHTNAYINLTSWQNGTIYFFPTNFCLRKPKMLEHLRSHRLQMHRTMFQLMVLLPNHDLKKNMTGQRMHIEGPQILVSMFY